MRLSIPAQAGLFRLLLALALLLISWTTLTPSPLPLPAGGDKLAHAGAFLLLAFLTDASWPTRPLDGRALTLLVLYGAGIELAQGGIPNRFMSLADLFANLAGLALYACLLGPRLRRRFAPG